MRNAAKNSGSDIAIMAPLILKIKMKKKLFDMCRKHGK
jgi:hypothetical protein